MHAPREVQSPKPIRGNEQPCGWNLSRQQYAHLHMAIHGAKVCSSRREQLRLYSGVVPSAVDRVYRHSQHTFWTTESGGTAVMPALPPPVRLSHLPLPSFFLHTALVVTRGILTDGTTLAMWEALVRAMMLRP